MSDAFVVVFVATLTAWGLTALVDLACRHRHGLAALRAVFGSVRGALLLPLVGGAVAAVAFTVVHRATELIGPASSLQGDADGCIHWLTHVEDSTLGVAAPAFFAAAVLCLSIRCLAGVRQYRWSRGLVARIDRVSTRALRGALSIPKATSPVYAARGIEGIGPFAARLGAKAAVLVPLSTVERSDEAAAIVAHERSHVARRHLTRRAWFEGAFGFWLPRPLAGRALREARVEEEWEADDDAARAVGSGARVARILVKTLERTVRGVEVSPLTASALASGREGFTSRIERLVSRTPPVRFDAKRAIALSACLGVAAFAAVYRCPDWSIWLFCQAERVLGVSCVY